MKKKIILFLILLLPIIFPKAETIYTMKNPDEVCATLQSNKLKLFVYSYYDDKSTEVGKVQNSCSNTSYYNNNLKTKKAGQAYNSWTWHGRADTTTKYYVENIEKEKKDYQYFTFSNRAQAYTAEGDTLNRLNALKPGEKVYFTIDISDLNLAANKYKDLRIQMDYGQISSDTNIVARNSIGYYLIGSDNKEYGPFRLADYNIQELVINESSSGSKTRVTKYRITSENTLSGVPSNIKINAIKIVPYDFYNTHVGYFRLYNLSLNGYSTDYTVTKNTITVNNAEDTIRHNITDNMLLISTLRWTIASDNTTSLEFYHHYATSAPQQYNGTTGYIYYGVPYVNTYNSTVESFLENTKKGKDSSGIDIYNYYLPTKYTKTTTSTKGNEIEENKDIPGTLYVYESNATNDAKATRKSNLETKDFVANSNYFFGLDCSSSTFLAEGVEIPVLYSMALSNRYSTSAEVRILGDAKLDNREFEKYLRDRNILKSDEQLTDDTYNNYYSQYFKQTNEADTIYDSYALAVPGDIIAKRGHVRMESGYPYVECNDGTKTQRYTKGFCNSHNGINPEKSYVITTEIGGSYGKQATKTVTYNGTKVTRDKTFAKESETGWSFKFNSKYTDMKKVDDFLNTNGNYIVNNKYSFKDLYGADAAEDDNEVASETGMYMAFRYNAMDTIANSKIEIPSIKTVGLSTKEDFLNTKELKGTIITNYLIQEVKYEINNQEYYIYPKQANVFSLYYDTTEEIKNIIKNTSTENLDFKISIKQGPDIETVQVAANQENNYGTVLGISTVPEPLASPTEEENPDTGSFITTLFIITLTILLFLANKQKNNYNKMSRI